LNPTGQLSVALVVASLIKRENGKTYFSHPSTAATPTSAARSSGLISFPFPGAVNVRNVDKILEAIGIAG